MSNQAGGYFIPPYERNDIAYWFPKLEQVQGIHVPETRIITTDLQLDMLLDGELPPAYVDFICQLCDAAESIDGYPCFLRTGHTSGKHSWKDTCYVSKPSDFPSHVAKLVEYSGLVDMLGLPTNTWAVRQLLSTRKLGTLPAYGDFPVVREIRGFIKDGEIVCVHPYWPRQALEQGFPFKALPNAMLPTSWGVPERELPAHFDKMVEAAQELTPYELQHVRNALTLVAQAFKGDGAWSVDLLDAGPAYGWWITDMAEAARSFHWPNCDKAVMFGAPRPEPPPPDPSTLLVRDDD